MEKWVVVLLLLAAMELAPAEVTRRYVGVGGELKVEPPKISGPITDVLWKYNMNLLAEWIKDPPELTYYGGFDGRTTLDTTTGALRVRNMRVEDAGLYRMEINSELQDLRYDVKVIQEVTEPKVVVQPVTCAHDHMTCTLTCDGETAGSEPVSYYWRRDDGLWEKSEKDLVITRTETGKVKTFSCRMENPVSHRDSEPEDNPLLRVNVGLVVGAAVGVTIIVIFIIGLSIFVQQRRKSDKLRRQEEDHLEQELECLSKQQQEHLEQELERLRKQQQEHLEQEQERLRKQQQEHLEQVVENMKKQQQEHLEQEQERLRKQQQEHLEQEQERLRKQQQEHLEQELENLRKQQQRPERKPRGGRSRTAAVLLNNNQTAKMN